MISAVKKKAEQQGRIVFEFGEGDYYVKGGAQLFPISSEDRKKKRK